MKHFHWKFIAYDSTNDKGEFAGAVEVSVVDYLSEEVALEAVRNIIKRPHYYLRKVWECTTCAFQKDAINAIKDMHS